VAVGLIGPDGRDFDLGGPGGTTTRVLRLAAPEQTFVFETIPARPVPSLLRNFSAPVILDLPCGDEDLAHLLARDSDPFNRWEAGQRLFGRLILGNAARLTRGEREEWPESVAAAARAVLESGGSPAFIVEALSPPGEATLAEQMDVVDPEALFLARDGLVRWLATALEADFTAWYDRLAPAGTYRWNTAEAARRRLRNLCLAYLGRLDSPDYRALALRQFREADNMTDQFNALAVLAQCACPERESALRDFYGQWRHEALVVDKWLSVQATSCLPGTLRRVEELTRHPAFDLRNPNKVYALLRGFGANHRHFHAADGAGYRFLAARIGELDPVNPQVAARLARCFDRWRKFDETHRKHARAALEGLRRKAGLSRDVFEVVEKGLGE
jgi:aminopeptidase N